MYGSWLTVLAWLIGGILGFLAIAKLFSFYYQLYQVNKNKNPTRASMYKTMMQNFAMEIVLLVMLIGFVLVALFYKPENGYGLFFTPG